MTSKHTATANTRYSSAYHETIRWMTLNCCHDLSMKYTLEQATKT